MHRCFSLGKCVFVSFTIGANWPRCLSAVGVVLAPEVPLLHTDPVENFPQGETGVGVPIAPEVPLLQIEMKVWQICHTLSACQLRPMYHSYKCYNCNTNNRKSKSACQLRPMYHSYPLRRVLRTSMSATSLHPCCLQCPNRCFVVTAMLHVGKQGKRVVPLVWV